MLHCAQGSHSPFPVQITALQAGNVTFVGETLLACPIGSNFNDSFSGLYEAGSYPVQLSYCALNLNAVNKALISTLDFQCVVCPTDQYSLLGGSSNGAVGNATNFPCLPCPIGGVCTGGVVGAMPGFWGAADLKNTASLVLCPTGYCCDGSVSWPCVGMGLCAGWREGALCGDCIRGICAVHTNLELPF
jgi:hypothetical protein